ncbi:MAG: hypothetical protein HYY06_03300 [Deltaproteobacteria bacterium]|nr:hypothetical protein [Deltaproteobacteria bacterium]
MRFRAPAKVFLSGEYAVLEGATAVVAAVSRHAVADTRAGARSDRPEVVAVARSLSADAPSVDVSALCRDGRKLGLGSSSAALVAAAGALLAERGVDLGSRAERDARLRELVELHRATQGGSGSGGDVAAALYGGVISYRALPAPHAEPFRLGRIGIVICDSGAAVRTAPLARAALEAGLPRSVHEAAAALGMALLSGDAAALREAVVCHLRGLEELSPVMGVRLLTPALERVIEIAGRVGACAKPAGAGGGDLAVAFARSPELAARLVDELGAEGLWAEEAVIDRDGARRDEG